MRFLVALALSSLALASASTHHKKHHSAAPLTEKQLEQEFSSFVKTHNKKYTHDEFFARFNTFKTNMEKIRIHNNSGARFSMASNEFADQTWQEFRSNKLGFKNVDNHFLRSKNAKPIKATGPLAAAVDWRKQGAVTPVKNQGQCGSCWAFSTTGSTEGLNFQTTGNLVALSEQQLIDCSTAQGNQGCNGGLMDQAFTYIISNGGIASEASYPYVCASGTCTASTCQTSQESVATIKGFQDIPAGDETSLLAAAAKQPVSVAIEADQEAFQFYSGGVMTGTCGTNLDHGVLVVGYGVDSGVNYWIVKNSWGATWGEAGYIRLERGINQCGLANSASVPTMTAN